MMETENQMFPPEQERGTGIWPTHSVLFNPYPAPTISLPVTLSDILDSITSLYARIPGAEITLDNARRMVREEARELTDELTYEPDVDAVLEEAMDVMYVAFGAALAAGATHGQIEAAARAVIAKNAAKSPETHVWDRNKITRR